MSRRGDTIPSVYDVAKTTALVYPGKSLVAQGDPEFPLQVGEFAPIKASPRVVLSPWGNVLVADHGGDGVLTAQLAQQGQQGAVLVGGKAAPLQPFELNANRKIVAPGASAPGGDPGVPGGALGAYKLGQSAVAPNHKMRRHPQPLNCCK